ncbi:MAG: ATP-binding protein [Thermovirgaceae bacterium]|nr:ATP-binding protein [Thermovirgaceae bacterium]
MKDFEKMGSFYLGKRVDDASGSMTGDLVLYDAKDLTTHGIIIGMTGSGKTGLALSLIEEALIDNIPVIAIDPKGDIPNLLLTFPQFRPADFRPWISEQEAARKGMSPDEFAEKTAADWKNGLAEWGIDGARIEKMRNSVDMTVYTPGSSAGRMVSILHSFDAPPDAIRSDGDLFRERIQTTAASLLSLMGIDADPLTSREHILISKILEEKWTSGHSLDIPSLIELIRVPPFRVVGVLDLETFYPSSARMELVLKLNNLVAAPSFGPWMEGEPLDAAKFLYTSDGRPRASIFTISHLSERERMFFVSLLLNEILGWVRTQPGTSSLRAILYMDEIFGFFPPVQNPPSKTVLLTLLKQARAYGLGVLLATQNPVDLDYKGISNTGTWFIGRLQTERDKMRILEGLKGVSEKGFPLTELDRMISSLGKRVFLLHNVHEDEPVLFQTRWAMSYLAGPVTREQIRSINGPPTAATPGERAHISEPAISPAARPIQEVLPPGVVSVFLPVSPGSEAEYAPFLGAFARVHFSDAKQGIEQTRTVAYAAEMSDGPVPVDWENSFEIAVDPSTLSQGMPSSVMSSVPTAGLDPKAYTKWGRDFLKWLPNNSAMTVMTCPAMKESARPGESKADFAARIAMSRREQRDAAVENIRKKYASKITTLQNRLMRAEQAVERESEQAKNKKMETAISFGMALAGAFLGRKINTYSASRVGTAVTKAARLKKETGDVDRAKDTAESVRLEMAELERQLEDEIKGTGFGETLETGIQESFIRPRASDMTVVLLGLLWLPYAKNPQGGLAPLWNQVK